MTENFPQINVRYQTTNPGSLENTKQDKDECKNKQKKIHVVISFSNYRKR